MFKSKPTITAKLISESEVKVKIKNKNKAEVIYMIFGILYHVADSMRLTHRELLNRLIDIDKQTIKNQKKTKKYNSK